MSRIGATTDSVLAFIKRFYHEKGYWPTTREIGEAIGLRSSSTVHYHIDRLEGFGFLRRPVKGVNRAFLLSDPIPPQEATTERETCAQIADDFAELATGAEAEMARRIAAAIRASRALEVSA